LVATVKYYDAASRRKSLQTFAIVFATFLFYFIAAFISFYVTCAEDLQLKRQMVDLLHTCPQKSNQWSLSVRRADCQTSTSTLVYSAVANSYGFADFSGL